MLIFSNMRSAKQGNGFKMFHWNGKLSFCLHVSSLLAQFSRCLTLHLNQNGGNFLLSNRLTVTIKNLSDPRFLYLSYWYTELYILEFIGKCKMSLGNMDPSNFPTDLFLLLFLLVWTYTDWGDRNEASLIVLN